MTKLTKCLCAQRRLADAQADPSLCWAHTHFVGFVMSWLNLWHKSFRIARLFWIWDYQVDRIKWIWYLSPMRVAKVQASLRIRAVSPKPSLLAHTSSESRGTFRQRVRFLALLNGWACAVKICHDRMLEDTNSLDAAQVITWTVSIKQLQPEPSEHFATSLTTPSLMWAPSSELVSSSIPSWQILTVQAQLFRGARDLGFCLKVPLDSLLIWASSGGSGETARMRRLAWTFAAHIGDKYQIRFTRSTYVILTHNLTSEIML